MSATITTSTANTAMTHRQRPTGTRTELDRYRAGGEDRILYGQRVDGVVRITDNPASGHGRAYLVERELEQDGYGAVLALVADYVAQAKRHNVIPAGESPLARYLKELP